MPGLTGHLFLVIPGLTRNLKTFKLKVKYFFYLKTVIGLVISVKGYTFAMDIEFKFMSIC